METKRTKVVMLATNNETMIRRNTYCFTKAHGNPLHYGKIENALERGFEYQNLYFTTDEEIKKTDWFYVLGYNTNCVQQCFECDDKIIQGRFSKDHYGNSVFRGQAVKIIASTDPTLSLPQPSQAFIKKYCELGGIDEVEVEYEDVLVSDIIIEGGNKVESLLKLHPIHNTITIHPIKDVWNREEVSNCMHYAFELASQGGKLSDLTEAIKNLK